LIFQKYRFDYVLSAWLHKEQGLHDHPGPPATKKAVRSIVRQMHILQIDSINVIARSHQLVLWSRLGDYPPRWLEDLLEAGALFEYWSRAASFLPIGLCISGFLRLWGKSDSRHTSCLYVDVSRTL
jgi:uncharacterized protein YcaQ